jgi:hypothetical protein
VVIMDTWAQVTPGANENSGEDMGKALAHCRGIGRMLRGAMVILVHHSGKDATKGARGWSGIRGGADTQLEVRRTLAGRVLATDKQKDGDDTGTWAFDLERVQVGVKDDLSPIYSMVVVPLDELPVQQVVKARRKLGVREQQFVDALTAELDSTGEASADYEQVIVRALAANPPADGKEFRVRGDLKRAAQKLFDDESTSYRLEDGRVYVD